MDGGPLAWSVPRVAVHGLRFTGHGSRVSFLVSLYLTRARTHSFCPLSPQSLEAHFVGRIPQEVALLGNASHECGLECGPLLHYLLDLFLCAGYCRSITTWFFGPWVRKCMRCKACLCALYGLHALAMSARDHVVRHFRDCEGVCPSIACLNGCGGNPRGARVD